MLEVNRAEGCSTLGVLDDGAQLIITLALAQHNDFGGTVAVEIWARCDVLGDEILVIANTADQRLRLAVFDLCLLAR